MLNMNSSKQSFDAKLTISPVDYSFINSITYILHEYIDRVMSGIGILINGFSLVILSNKKLKHDIYNFFFCRALFNIILCLTIAGSIDWIYLNQEGTYYLIAYQFYISYICFKVILMSTSISDLFLVIERYFVITKKKNSFIKLPKMLNLFFCLLFPICIYTPSLFAVQFTKNNNNDMYNTSVSEFGASFYFKIYSFFVLSLETIFPVVLLTVLNILCICKFKIYMKKKEHLIANNKESKKAKIRFSKMTNFLISICILNRVFLLEY